VVSITIADLWADFEQSVIDSEIDE